MVQISVSRGHLMVVAAIVAVGVLVVWSGVEARVSAATSRFDDVSESSLFRADIDWLADAGITRGCNPPANTRFCPSEFVTREQMAAFMHRLSGGDNRTVDGRLNALEAENKALRDLLAGVSRNRDTLVFSGMNLQVVNGTGTTSGTPNGIGNVIVGYNELPPSTPAGFRDGSHYLIVGSGHTYTSNSYGGIVSGFQNTVDSVNASVTGGAYNTASGVYSSVTGGLANSATRTATSVTGGSNNTASAEKSSVTGGDYNTAGGWFSSVTGGVHNTASGLVASVSGGQWNVADGPRSSICGGEWNEAVGEQSSISGGEHNDALGHWSSVSGGQYNVAQTTGSSILGGASNTVTSSYGHYPN